MRLLTKIVQRIFVSKFCKRCGIPFCKTKMTACHGTTKGGGELCNPDAAANTFIYVLNYAATLLLMLHDTSWSFCCSCKDKDAVSIVGQNRYIKYVNLQYYTAPC